MNSQNSKHIIVKVLNPRRYMILWR